MLTYPHFYLVLGILSINGYAHLLFSSQISSNIIINYCFNCSTPFTLPPQSAPNSVIFFNMFFHGRSNWCQEKSPGLGGGVTTPLKGTKLPALSCGGFLREGGQVTWTLLSEGWLLLQAGVEVVPLAPSGWRADQKPISVFNCWSFHIMLMAIWGQIVVFSNCTKYTVIWLLIFWTADSKQTAIFK